MTMSAPCCTAGRSVVVSLNFPMDNTLAQCVAPQIEAGFDVGQSPAGPVNSNMDSGHGVSKLKAILPVITFDVPASRPEVAMLVTRAPVSRTRDLMTGMLPTIEVPSTLGSRNGLPVEAAKASTGEMESCDLVSSTRRNWIILALPGGASPTPHETVMMSLQP